MYVRLPNLYVPRSTLTTSWETKNAEERERVTGSGLISAKEWTEFIDWHLPKIQETAGWVRLLVVATVAVHQGALLMARRIRKNANWAGSGTEDDWMGIETVAMDKLNWFRQNCPGPLERRSLPPWGNFLIEALEGAFLTIARVAREVDQVQRKGHLLVNVAPGAAGVSVDNDVEAEEDRG